MVYDKKHRSNRIRRWGSAIGTGVLVLVLFVLFVFAVKWFRAPSEGADESLVGSITDVLTPDPISEAVLKGIDTQSKDATLRWIATGELLGEAERGVKDDGYYFEAELALPEIDRDIHYYQLWLVRKLPYDYFSLGEMVTDEDGKFVLEWEIAEDEGYFDYTQIVITVNQYDGSPDPGKHLVRGEFGE
jgi:hypothetical protein